MLVDCPATGPSLLEHAPSRSLFMFNHVEYDSFSLKEEYERDRAAGNGIARYRIITSRTMTRPARRSIAGAAMRTCYLATGSTRSISPRPMIWLKSGGGEA